MGPVWALLLLLPVAQGAETCCDARKNNTVCYGTLGGTIQVRLMDSGSVTQRCQWKKKGEKIFEWKNKSASFDKVKNRSEFFSDNGIFHLRNLSKNDSGSYILEYIDKDGRTEKTFLHKLMIEEPVSSLHLQHQCLSKGEVQVSWTSEGGDSPEFSCTLNGQKLTDSQLLSKNKENQTITLRQNTEGLLHCSVKNNISEVNETLQISSCGFIFINCTSNGKNISGWVFKDNNTMCVEPTTSAPITPVGPSVLTPLNNQTAPWYSRYKNVIAGAGAGAVFLGIGVIVLCCVLKRKRKNNNDAEHELTYADVKILQQPGRRPQQLRSEEVEYDQVKFSNQNQRVAEALGDTCIYSQVRR